MRINQRVIAIFTHKREDGLAVCLSRAAIAANKASADDFIRLLSGALDA